ncbi:hypothetical protein [Peribacillus tepidiphilus]|uniref:hypothetical protein n=1 Tax=Peribacillus tepidiphilus TaxID=2652445 RepID=UPI0012925018|nr:hypothetical protein [Peribacillus tepidiphilus]
MLVGYLGHQAHKIGRQSNVSVIRPKISVVVRIYRSSGSKYRSSFEYIGHQAQNIGRQSNISVIRPKNRSSIQNIGRPQLLFV